jgi:hypothetical protein
MRPLRLVYTLLPVVEVVVGAGIIGATILPLELSVLLPASLPLVYEGADCPLDTGVALPSLLLRLVHPDKNTNDSTINTAMILIVFMDLIILYVRI